MVHLCRWFSSLTVSAEGNCLKNSTMYKAYGSQATLGIRRTPKSLTYDRFEVYTAAIIHSLWSCGLWHHADRWQRFGESYCLHLQGSETISMQNMDVVYTRTSEMLYPPTTLNCVMIQKMILWTYSSICITEWSLWLRTPCIWDGIKNVFLAN
jgi:hypothetical protein